MEGLPRWRDLRKTGLRGLLRELLREHDSPVRVSMAIAVGVLIGTLPFFGLHMWIGLAVALIARLNKLAVFLGTQVSLPWVAPLLIAGSVETGWFITHGEFLGIHPSSLHVRDLLSYFVPWLAGSLVLGAALGTVAFFLSYWSIRILRRPREAAPDA